MFGAVAAELGVQLALLGLLHRYLGMDYALSMLGSVFVVITFNFIIHNISTFDDRMLNSIARFKGWLLFCLASVLSVIINIAVVSSFFSFEWHWVLPGLFNVSVGSIVNYDSASRYTWKPIEH